METTPESEIDLPKVIAALVAVWAISLAAGSAVGLIVYRHQHALDSANGGTFLVGVASSLEGIAAGALAWVVVYLGVGIPCIFRLWRKPRGYALFIFAFCIPAGAVAVFSIADAITQAL